MTDAAYVFTQDVKERGKMKTGAMHKKNGSKSKKCTLPSDYLTPAKQKKLNGECHTICMNRPITDIKEFRKYPYNLQQEYLQNLANNYGARLIDVCNMFGTKQNNFCSYLKLHNISVEFNKLGRGKASHMDERWLEFITRPDLDEDAEVHKDIEVSSDIISAKTKTNSTSQIKVPSSSPFEIISDLRITLDGSKAEIMKALELLLADETNYDCFINFRKKG